MIKNKRILIIGGTGALGKTLVKRYYDSNEIIVLSRDEHKHYYLQKEYPNVHSIIGDVKDKSSIKNCLLRFIPHIVINAAALKHVPICEDDPFESVKTNIIGHQNIIESVSEVGFIETLIFVSTDKACNPINVYGMCKSISERLYVEYAKQRGTPKVVLVRYGNVLESTGSVIPFFKSLLNNSECEYIPITDENMTRFLLTLEQATELIDWAYSSDKSHGKIAVPKIKSLKITDIADVLKKSYGMDSVPLKIIGIRPGEKLHEEMISNEEWMRTENHGNFLIGDENFKTERKSYNSLDSLMDSSEAENFLKESGVI
tara:strand:+ start:432 stop:1379 length:948 start_codon:yes stop_codon:yes gene_type:complete